MYDYNQIFVKHVRNFDDIEIGFSLFLSEMFRIADKSSLISAVCQMRNGSLLSIRPDINVNIEYESWSNFLLKKEKKSLLLNVSSAYGWELIADEVSSSCLRIISALYSLEYLKTYKPLRKHIKDSVNSYLCLPFDERVSRLVEQFNNVCYNEYLSLYNWGDHISKDMDATRIDNDVAKYVKECMCELPVEIIHKLASLPVIDWLDRVTIMRIPNAKKKNMPIDFFSNLSYFNVFYGSLPFDLINLYIDEKYYYLVFLDYFLDDSECRISTNIDFGFLNPESLMLFKEFNAIA